MGIRAFVALTSGWRACHLADSNPRSTMSRPEPGSIAPDFELPADDGTTVRLSALRGRPVVLYFYPKDDTPGCTTEACDFRDRQAQLQLAGDAVVLGVSADSLKSHGKFRDKYSLPFRLLSDADRQVMHAYGVWGEKMMYGKTMEGVIRSTYVIDQQGRIARAWPKVSVKGHADEVLAAVQALV
jgi:peroxiredoxin Q/BCP